PRMHRPSVFAVVAAFARTTPVRRPPGGDRGGGPPRVRVEGGPRPELLDVSDDPRGRRRRGDPSPVEALAEPSLSRPRPDGSRPRGPRLHDARDPDERRVSARHARNPPRDRRVPCPPTGELIGGAPGS